MARPVDLTTWNRKDVHEFFRNFEDPFFNVTVTVDVTVLVSLCKERGYSFAAACLFFSQLTANEIREFRIRMVDGELVEYDEVEATQTILQDDESFSFCYFRNQPDLSSFISDAKTSVEKYLELRSFDVEQHRHDLIYHSILPWLPFTSFKHATSARADQTVPRIVFGQYTPDATGRLRMPVCVEVNHSIMDGIHVGKYFKLLQQNLDNAASL